MPASTTQVWLKDAEDLAATETFLRARIENVMQIEKWKAKVKQVFQGATS